MNNREIERQLPGGSIVGVESDDSLRNLVEVSEDDEADDDLENDLELGGDDDDGEGFDYSLDGAGDLDR